MSSAIERCGGACEICSSSEDIREYSVEGMDEGVAICALCAADIEEPSNNPNQFRSLVETIWSPIAPLQVLSYRLLKKLQDESWALDTLQIAYLEPELLAIADSIFEESASEPTRDSNGTVLQEGDSVSIIKDLEVKGVGFTAKQGTTVKNIHLTSNPEQIEGRVNGVKIVLLSKFLKKI